MTELLKSYKLIVYYLGVFMLMIGGIILLPILMLIFYPYEYKYAYCFIIPGIGSIIIGFILFFIFKNCEKKNLERHQDAVFVVSIWLIAILFASFPFLSNTLSGFFVSFNLFTSFLILSINKLPSLVNAEQHKTT